MDGERVRESQKTLCCQCNLMMMIYDKNVEHKLRDEIKDES